MLADDTCWAIENLDILETDSVGEEANAPKGMDGKETTDALVKSKVVTPPGMNSCDSVPSEKVGAESVYEVGDKGVRISADVKAPSPTVADAPTDA